jgi:hypothetical protein
MNSLNNHKIYLKKFFNHGAVYFGIMSFLIVLIVPTFLDIFKYFAWLLYAIGLFCLYWAGYKTWEEIYTKESHKKVTISIDKGKISHKSGTGRIFKKCILEVRISIANHTNFGAVLDNFIIEFNQNIPWLKPSKYPQVLKKGGKNINKSVELGPKESKIVYLKMGGQNKIEDEVNLAKAFRKYPEIPAKLTTEAFLAGKRYEICSSFKYSAKKLINKMIRNWESSRLTEALKVMN